MTTVRRFAPYALGILTGGLLAAGGVLGIAKYLSSGVPAAAMAPPHFAKEAAGVDHVYDGEFQYFVGGGVAVFDCDGDLRQDLFFAGGVNQSALFRNQSPVGGSLEFDRVEDAGAEFGGVTGAYPLDVDADGLLDLAVLRAGENQMMRGIGDCRFERANEAWGIDGGADWTVAFSATWEPGNGRPTLAFGNYVALDDDGRQTGSCSEHQLFRPRAVSYPAPESLTPGWCTLSILFSDWDRSGRRDLRMTNDRHYYRDGEEQLWRIEPGHAARLYTHAEGWQPMKIWGMGIASYDLTGDGKPEVFLTSQSDNKLQTLVEGATTPHYEDMAFRVGATAHRPYVGDVDRPSTAWHPQFEDVNNDGLVDLFVSKGNVEAMPEYAAKDPNNLLLQGPDGTFREAAGEAGLTEFGRSRGAALADLNLDGMLDLVVVVRRENVAVWRNVGWGDQAAARAMGNWIAILLEDEGPNRDAVGAWLEVKTGRRVQEREITVGGGHAGGVAGWTHFGLGDSDSLAVRVQWPDGETGPWMNVGANQFVIIDRESLVPWEP